MKILELTNFSAGSCGVWTRVKQESELLSQKNEVIVFSSNATKDSDIIAPEKDKIGKIKIKRFPFKKLGGESFMSWNFEKEAITFNPDIIISHVYRHPHTKESLKLAKKLRKRGKKCKVFLVTHAPFVPDNSTRSTFSKIVVKLYDFFIGPRIINKFDKVIPITKWEISFLKKLGVKEDKIVYIPNGIPNNFFTQKKAKSEDKILFLGRISPIKSLETAILALPLVDSKEIKLEFVGPADEDYLKKLKALVNDNKLEKRVTFSKGVYNLNEKIKKIDSCNIFVLPSLREAMPQALIEAMSREKIVIASNNLGARDLIKDKETGFLFNIGDEKDLADKINFALKNKSTGKRAKDFVERFNWDNLIKKYEVLIGQSN